MEKTPLQPALHTGPLRRNRRYKHLENTRDPNIEPFKCTVCSEQFTNLPECLKHELLQHSYSSRKNKRQSKTLRKKLNSILNCFKEEIKKSSHAELRAALHKCEPGQELSTIFKYNRMNDENLTLVYERISACLQKELNSLEDIEICPFGSFVSGLALRDSDIDIYIENTTTSQPMLQMKGKNSSAMQRAIYNRINRILHSSRDFSDVIAIRQARVPIIKCKHIRTGFSLDINLSCPSSVHNTNFLRDLMKFDKRLHELMIFLKVWAKLLQIVGHCKMTSYCLITLIIFYLQQKQANYSAILPAIKTLQSDITPQMVIGVNYAYDLCRHMSPLPRELTSTQLIKNFFYFYQNFDFNEQIIAPYLGETIPKEQFKSGTYKYLAYDNQLRAMSILNGKTAEAFQINYCVCVQDPFSLNHNVGKCITPIILEYVQHCMKYACDIFENPKLSTDAQLYDSLMYEMLPSIAQQIDATNSAVHNGSESNNEEICKKDEKQETVNPVSFATGTSSSENLPNELIYRFTPGRAELRAIALHAKNNDPQRLYELWVQYYIDAITEIITAIYCIDMQSVTPTHNGKQQRLERDDCRHTWLISASVDQWTGRLHQRCGNQTFMEIQSAQTKKFAVERRQNANFAVQLNAILTLNIICHSTAIEIILTPRDNNSSSNLNKKDPLRKFFMMFKCSMQNFNLKEKLQGAVTKEEGREKFKS